MHPGFLPELSMGQWVMEKVNKFGWPVTRQYPWPGDPFYTVLISVSHDFLVMENHQRQSKLIWLSVSTFLQSL